VVENREPSWAVTFPGGHVPLPGVGDRLKLSASGAYVIKLEDGKKRPSWSLRTDWRWWRLQLGVILLALPSNCPVHGLSKGYCFFLGVSGNGKTLGI
jgi:hypothetical protein